MPTIELREGNKNTEFSQTFPELCRNLTYRRHVIPLRIYEIGCERYAYIKCYENEKIQKPTWQFKYAIWGNSSIKRNAISKFLVITKRQ